MAIKIFFGVPGAGKTTHAASIVYKNLKKGIPTFSNVDIKGAIRFSATDDLGKYQIENADMIIDEAGIEFNSRGHKEFAKSHIAWFKLHRHYGIRNIYVYSQSYVDMDVTIRRLASELYVVRKSLIPFVVSTIPIKVKIGIDEESHQIIDQYFFHRLGFKLMWSPAYWSMFDSWEAPALIPRKWFLTGYGQYTGAKGELKVAYKDIRKSKSLFKKLYKTIRKAAARMNRSMERRIELSSGEAPPPGGEV